MKGIAASISLAALLAAAYAVGVVVLAPISFHIIQVRVADALLPLSILLGWPAIIGLTIGTVVANLFGGLGAIDIVGGSLANLVAGVLAWRIGQGGARGSWLVAVLAEILVVTTIVGTYLSYLFGMPIEAGLLGVFLGSLIAIGLIGYSLLTAISRSAAVNLLKSAGVTVYIKDN